VVWAIAAVDNMAQQIARIARRMPELRAELDVVRTLVLEKCAALLKAMCPNISSGSRSGLI
jgi:hypothetical protein